MKSLLAFLVVVLALTVGCASTNAPYFGEYQGENYTFTLDENGLDVDHRYQTKWVIVNNQLRIFHIDGNGTVVNETTFQFSETDSTYVISTQNANYILRKAKNGHHGLGCEEDNQGE